MALPKLFQRIFWHNNTTPAINEDNLNAISKAVDDIDDRVIDLAGTIMEDVPEIQHDLEILEPAIENIDANVTRAETAADNAEEDALKSEGYAVGTQDGVEVTSGEYYQNNAKYYAEIANPPIENTVDFTDIITISDAINKAAKDVRLKIEPVQDLHGYTKPWVGGAGKNKLPLILNDIKAVNTAGTWNGNVYTYRGITYTINVDGDDNITSIKVNGTASENSFLRFTDSYQTASQLGLELNTTYTLSGCPSGGGANTYNLRYDSGGAWAYPIDAGNGIQFTFTSSTNTYGPRIYIDNGTTVNNILFYPQMEKGTKTAFESYTNICPITGHSEANVIRATHNLGVWTNKSLTGDDYYGYRLDNGGSSLIARVKPNTSYVASRKSGQGNRFRIVGFVNEPSSTSSTAAEQLYSNNSTNTYTFNSGKYNFIVFTYDSFSSIAQDTAESMIKLATDTDPTYEPYQGKELTISLNGTRYGGTLDVTSGVLTVDRVAVDLDSLSFGTYNSTNRIYYSSALDTNRTDIIFEDYATTDSISADMPNGSGSIHGGNHRIYIRDMRYNETEFNNATKGNAVYYLATPQTIQLTPTEVNLLYGYNTLFGDCGDISLTYDASGIIHIDEAKLDTETLKTIAAASSDFADFKARIAAL